MAATALHVGIAIIGTGFSGLGMAIRLKDAGIHDFVLLERGNDVGGVWRDNTYPGCACDVESHLYAFSFAPNPGWSRKFAGQSEILAYLRDCAERFGILPHIRFEHEVQGATWDENACLWRIETSAGPVNANVLISGMGGLSEPAVPPLPGLDRFAGVAFHSARWDHTHDLTGRTVAVVGTGASAIQFVPAIQPQVARLYLFQRTAPWVVPRRDRALSALARWCLRVPALQNLLRLSSYLIREFYGLAFRNPAMMRFPRRAALRHLKRAVADPALRAKLTPDYEIGCKRILLSDDYYPALVQPNVEVVTEPIKEIHARSMVTSDGREREIDTIIFGTGFHVTNHPAAALVRGREGRQLNEALGDSPRAYLGTTFAGFPNFFMLQGPNTGLGHSSVVLMIEHQIGYILSAIRYMREHRVAAVEPTPSAQARFVDLVDTLMQGTVWTSGGCNSWYLDRTGRNSTLWPSSIAAFGRRVARFRRADHALVHQQEAVGHFIPPRRETARQSG